MCVTTLDSRRLQSLYYFIFNVTYAALSGLVFEIGAWDRQTTDTRQTIPLLKLSPKLSHLLLQVGKLIIYWRS